MNNAIPTIPNLSYLDSNNHHRVYRRDREPSRVPVRTLKSLRKKNRKLKAFLHKRICQSTPNSSKVRCYVREFRNYDYRLNSKRVSFNKLTQHERKLLLNCSRRVYRWIMKLKYRAIRYSSLFSCNRPMCLYKNQSHISNYCKSKLSTDIERNPGPTTMYIDPSKTISAPYSQGNELVLGQNSGQQCVAMSLCSLIYNNKQGINSANDLMSIMDIGNQLYSGLSQLATESFLMQSELPPMLNVFDTDYELQYSESYTGTVLQETTIEGYQYCTSLQRAFESLLAENYTSFVLTVGSTAVAIYCNGNAGFKIFDSHARDLYGRSHAQGTCVLLDISTVNNLVHYFQSIHNNDVFEVKGLQINAVQDSILDQNHAHVITHFSLSCAVAIYSLYYAIMKPCGYWNTNTLLTIVDNGKRLHDNLCMTSFMQLPDFPKTVHVCGAEVSLELLSDCFEGLLSDSVHSKSILQDIIIKNSDYTGFVMWFSGYCISCIFKPTKKSKYLYSLLNFNQSRTPPIQYTKNINGTSFLVEVIVVYVTFRVCMSRSRQGAARERRIKESTWSTCCEFLPN